MMLPLMIFACIATVTVATTAAWQGSSGWSGVAGARGRLRRCRDVRLIETKTRKASSSLTQCNMAVKEATFGMGCFWKPSEELLKVPGVVDTIVGYSGHPTAERTPPTYETVCFGRDWVEAVRVRYDDDILSYHQLLDAFFETQEPKLGGSRQYASIIFAHSNCSNSKSNGGTDDQTAVAQQWLDDNRLKVRRRDNVAILQETTIEAPSPFFKAEEYHQRYWQKLRPRFAIAVLLLAVNMGALDAVLNPILSFESLMLVHRAANIIVLLGLVWVLLERAIDTKTVEL